MKRLFVCALPALAGAILGVAACRATKGAREKAIREGRHAPYGPYEALVKRPLDALLSGVALMALSPVILVTAALVRARLGAPVLFRQERPGKDGTVFTLFKFRTMSDRTGADGRPLPDGERLTDFGRKLRETSLDELPELFNILKGDMAVVGPRPLLVEYLPRYTERQRHRHDVRPGLTGLAQVSGRNALSWEERLEDDVRYAGKVTFLGDLKIVMDTVGVVLRRDGVSSPTSATMEEFMGRPEGEGADIAGRERKPENHGRRGHGTGDDDEEIVHYWGWRLRAGSGMAGRAD